MFDWALGAGKLVVHVIFMKASSSQSMHGGFDFQRENDRHGFSILKFVISSSVKVSPIDSYVIVHTKDKDRFPTIYPFMILSCQKTPDPVVIYQREREIVGVYGRGSPRACKGKQETVPCTLSAWFRSAFFDSRSSPQILHLQCISFGNSLICLLTKYRLREPGFLYILRRSFSGSPELPRQIKQIVGRDFSVLTQTEAIA